MPSAVPGNFNNLLAPEEEDQTGRMGRVGSTKMFRFDKDKVYIYVNIKFHCLIRQYHSQIFQLCFCVTVLNRPLRQTEEVPKHFCHNIKYHRFSFSLNYESERFLKNRLVVWLQGEGGIHNPRENSWPGRVQSLLRSINWEAEGICGVGVQWAQCVFDSGENNFATPVWACSSRPFEEE